MSTGARNSLNFEQKLFRMVLFDDPIWYWFKKFYQTDATMKTVLITGATSGFGEKLVSRFLEGGYRVVATGRDLQKRKEIFSVLRPIFADRLIELSLDVTKSNEIQSVAEFVGSQFSGLDILINNAGYGYFCPLEEAVHDEVRRQMEVNFLELFL